jgi:hypothetical protein
MGQRYRGKIFCSVTTVTLMEKNSISVNSILLKNIIVGFIVDGIKRLHLI